MRLGMFDRVQRFARGTLLTCGLALAVSLPSHAETPDAAGILAASDKARGGGLPGIEWQVDVNTVAGKAAAGGGDSKENEPSTMSVLVKSNGDDNMMEIRAPIKARGRKILMRGNNMWFISPTVTKPVPISPRQRLTGQASYGDIAATNYVNDYSATMAGTETVDGIPCHVLDLTAVNKSVTYDKVKYWVAQDTGLGIKAEFFTISGKHIKTARFKYDNQIKNGGQMIPFVSEMKIVDALAGNALTTLSYSAIEVRALSARDFRLN